MRPDSISERMVRSLRTTGGAVYSRVVGDLLKGCGAGADKGGMERRDEDSLALREARRRFPAARRSRSSTSRTPHRLPRAGPVEVSGPTVEEEQDLHVCATCASELVYPAGWEEAGPDAWHVTLRCPECETCREGVFSQDTVDAFDEELDAGTEALTADLRRLARANMAGEVDRFAAALAADAILPEDF